MPIDPKSLPQDPQILQQMLVDLTAQLDKTQRLLRQLLAAKSGTRSEQISADQLRLFAQELGIAPAIEESKQDGEEENSDAPPPAANSGGEGKPRGRQPLPRHLKRERIVHDLAEVDKHCAACGEDLRHIGEEVSERYEWLRSSHSFAAIHSGADGGDRRCLPEVCLRLQDRDRHQAGTAD